MSRCADTITLAACDALRSSAKLLGYIDDSAVAYLAGANLCPVIKPGAAFVGFDGKPVTVTAVSRERTTGDVYNFKTASDIQLGHIIVAEGVLVGDQKLQNDLAFEQAGIELRR